MSSASSGSSSSSPEPPIVQPKKKSGKTQRKQGVVISTPHRENEAAQVRTSPYEPPEGSVPFEHDVDFGEFDWDSVKDDEDVELWLIRVPDTIKPKNIENLKVDHPSSSRSVRVGQLERKHTKYDVWSLGEAQDGDDEPIGGEEMKGLSCLLPRKRKDGKLYLAPKPISRHLVLSALCASDPADGGPTTTSYQNPPRHSYSKELFKHRFTPYGSLASAVGNGEGSSSVDVEMVDVSSSSPVGSARKGKKRPRESDPPKRSKKVKASKAPE